MLIFGIFCESTDSEMRKITDSSPLFFIILIYASPTSITSLIVWGRLAFFFQRPTEFIKLVKIRARNILLKQRLEPIRKINNNKLRVLLILL